MSWVNEDMIPIESPRKELPIRRLNDIRATILLWHDLHRFGVSLRAIASCFKVSHKLVGYHIHRIPMDVKAEHESEEYLAWLCSALTAPESMRPTTGAELRSFLQKFGAARLQRRSSVSEVQDDWED